MTKGVCLPHLSALVPVLGQVNRECDKGLRNIPKRSRPRDRDRRGRPPPLEYREGRVTNGQSAEIRKPGDLPADELT